MLKIKPTEKTKLKKSDIILFGKARWDALSPTWQENFLEIYEYASPYKALGAWYKELFTNNPELKFNKIEDLNKQGQVTYRVDKNNSNKPRFAFIVNKICLKTRQIRNISHQNIGKY